MSRLPIPFRRKQTPLERAIDLGAKALKLYAASRVAKKGAKVPLIGVGLAGALVAAKKLTGRKSEPPMPPAPAPYTPPVPDKGRRESPHGDVAADLLKGDEREASSGGRNVGASAPLETPSAPPAGTAGTADGADVAAKEVPPPSEAEGETDVSTSSAPGTSV
jgi:hypothetical protein